MTRMNVFIPERLATLGQSLVVLRRAGLLIGMRPDKYFRIASEIRRHAATNTVGVALSARRCPERAALIDELGVLTYRELDERANAFAAALQQLSGQPPQTVGIMCRNHRGFVDALAAADRIGADVLLLNTAFAGPALSDVVSREQPDVIIYDEEFSAAVERATTEKPDVTAIAAWTDNGHQGRTIEKLIATHAGQRPEPSKRTGKLILLTSGTTGSPKGARRSGGAGPDQLVALLSRVPWRAEETVVVAAPMFHAWGYSQLVLGSLMSCTLVVRRIFHAEATLALVDRHRASGLCVVPAMIDRIAELSEDVRHSYSGRSLRFVTASGSRMRPDTTIEFMDQFGDVVYNNYNGTEVGMIAGATPEDLRAAPDTAGKPFAGVDIRILDDHLDDVAVGEVGRIFARSTSQFEGYTSGVIKEFFQGYMASGDLGYLDETGRLFVVGRDDEMIVSGGENVYPIEVEKILEGHSDVTEAVVVGVDDEKFGQRLIAFVVAEHKKTINPEALKDHVRDHLASFKVPREITVVDELPRNSTGKIVRRELQARIGADPADG